MYSPLGIDNKRVLWKELISILDCTNKEAVCFIGDFNCVRAASEKVNCIYNHRDSEEFNEMVEDNNLVEISMINSNYTWFGPDGRKSRLDRVLINDSWSRLGSWIVKSLSRKHSDHKPILLYLLGKSISPKPFKIFNCFLTDSLLEEVKQLSATSEGWSDKNLHLVLKEIKGLVKKSSANAKSKLDLEIASLEDKVDNMDDISHDGKDLQGIRERLVFLYNTRDSMLKQKSRVPWLQKGDGNNKFFHQTIHKRFSVNNIIRIDWEGKVVSDSSFIRNAFFSHYSRFFKESGPKLLKLNSLRLTKISDANKGFLNRLISHAEIDLALHSLADDKAPGPNGMNIKSIKFLWPCIGNKVRSFISEFCETGSIPLGLNSSFFVLIPKTISPTQIKDYRLISLINSTVKILMKVLANRLASLMKHLISDTQSGFVKGRQSSESILIVKEVAHSLQKNRCKGVILKLDFEKAFDTVNWDFLMDTMMEMNLGHTWCNWIRALLDSVRISILINGTPTKEFKPERGLRQGDP